MKMIFLPTSSVEGKFNVVDGNDDDDVVDEEVGTADASVFFSICESKYCTEKFFI